MFKKLLALSLVFIGALTLSACNPDKGLTTEEILTQIQEALDELSLPTETSTNLTLPNSGLHDVVITWSSSNTDYITDAGVVTIPTKTEGNKSVVMTATLSLEDQELIQRFTVIVTAATALNDAEKVAADKADVFVPEGQTFGDVTLPTSGANGTTITWASSNAAVVTTDGTVNRPDPDGVEVTVTLTATITSGTASDTKSFVLLVQPSVYTMDIADLFVNFALDAEDPDKLVDGDTISVKGVVISLVTVSNKGFYIYDGTGFLFAYTNEVFEIGDVVLLQGAFDEFYGLFEIKNLTTAELLEETIAMPAPKEVTVADIIAYGTTPAYDIHSELINITGTVTADTTYYYLEDENGNKVELNDDSDISLLIALLGKNITMTGVYHSYHSGHGNHQITFSGLAEYVTENVLSEADALAADIATVGSLFPEAAISDLTLPTTGANGTVFSAWASSNTAIFANDGTFVAQGTTEVTITFTATATNGAETGTVSVEVVVPIDTTIPEAEALSSGDYVVLTGVVYLESYYGFHIAADGKYIFIGDTSYLDNIQPGDEVTIVGKMKNPYHGAAQVASLSYVVNSSSNTVPTPVVTSLSDVIAAEVPYGTLVTLTGNVVEVASGSYFNLYFDDAAGNRIQIHYNSNDFEIDDFKGQMVTADFLVYASDYLWFYGVAADVTVVTAFTEQQQAEAVALAVINGLGNVDSVAQNLVLPTTFADPAATIAWATSDAAVVTTGGVVTFASGSQATATLTMTVTVGTTDVVKTIVVTLVDADDLVPTTVATALLATNGDTVVVTGVVTGFSYKHGAFIQDSDGTAIYLNNEDLEDTLSIGDLVVVVGKLNEYTSYSNHRRELVGVSVLSTTSTGNTVFVDDTVLPVTLGVLATVGTYSSQTFTMTLTFADYQVENPGTYNAGTMGYQDNYGYYFFVGDGTTYITMYSGDCPICASLFAVGDTITLTFSVYDVNFSNIRIDNVTLPTITDTQALVVAEAMLDLDATVTEDLTLPTELYGVTIAWSSDTPLVISDAGVVVRPAVGEADAAVVLTATLSIGTETDVVLTFNITVTAEPASADDVATAVAAADNTPLFISGVVTSILPDGTFTIEDADGTAIYVDDIFSTITDFATTVVVAVGDEVEVTGLKSTYNGTSLVDTVSAVTVVSTGNAITAPIAVTDLATFRAAVDGSSFGKRYAFTGLMLDDQGYYLYFYNDNGTNRMGIVGDYSSAIVATLGNDKVTFVATLYAASGSITDPTKILRFAVTLDSDLTVIPLTDAEKLALAEDQLSVPTTAIADLTLPTELNGVTIAWSSDTPATISDAGVVVRPANGSGDATVVLTATLSIGTETDVVLTFTVTVTEEAPASAYDHTENFSTFVGSGTSYVSETFTGDSGFSWDVTLARKSFTGYEIDGAGIMFKVPGTATAAAVTGGIGDLSLDIRMGFTGGTPADRTVSVYVNDNLVGTYTLTTTNTVENLLITGINVEGTFKLEIVTSTVDGRQIVINNLEWTEYSTT